MVIDGGTLTSACEGTMWQGITVSGNGSLQGQIELKNNGKIENAVCAITVNNGGIVTTNSGAQFLNNKAGVKFAQANSNDKTFSLLSPHV